MGRQPIWEGAENLATPPGFDPRTVQPVASRYTDYPVVAPLSTEAQKQFYLRYMGSIEKHRTSVCLPACLLKQCRVETKQRSRTATTHSVVDMGAGKH